MGEIRRFFIKRLFDIVCSLFGLMILSPVFVLIAFIIVLESKGGIFFRGVRVGQYGKPFRIFKFRSMRPDSEGNGKWNIGADDPRITRVGQFLRKTKIDELPQLINVLIGHMSMVGPRPELQIYVDMYTEEEKRILEMKPGITDWASVTYMEQYIGFTNSSDPDLYYLEHIRPIKLQLQLYYYDHRSFLEDLKIIILTVIKVATKKGHIPREIEDTMTNIDQQQRMVNQCE